MKKTLIAVAISSVFIFGCSESEDKTATSPSKNDSTPLTQEAVAAFNQDLLNSSQAIYNIGSRALANVQIAYNSFEEKDNRIHYVLETKQSEKINKVDNIGYSVQWFEKGVAALNNYGANKGQANITGSADLDIQVTEGEKTVFETRFLKDGTLDVVLDRAKNTVKQSIVFKDQKNSLAGGDVNFANYEIANISFNDVIEFNNDLKEVTAFDGTVSLSNFKLESAPEMAMLFTGSALLESIKAVSQYQLAPFAVKGDAVFTKLVMNAAADGETYTVTIPEIKGVFDAKESNQIVSGKLDYTIGDIGLEVASKGKASLGSFQYNLGIEGVKKSDDWIKFLAMAQSIDNPDNLSQEEAKELIQLLANVLTKDSAINMIFSNKISGAEGKFTFAIKPTERFVTQAQSNVEELASTIAGQSVTEIIENYLEVFNYTLVVPENYVIEQYSKIALFKGQDQDKAKQEAKTGIQQVVMISAMAGMSASVSPIKYENGVLSMDIAYKNKEWNINGTKVSTEELMKLVP